MAEVRLVGLSEDGTHLVLADAEGNEHTIVIDERLRAGVHGHLSRLGQLTMALESPISPREIQNRVRAGESAEDVAQTAGVPIERVLRFIGPVLREREHVADQARRARLAGTGGPSSLIGDLVARAATRRGVDPDDVSWDSARREDLTWVVSAQWPDGTTATWALDAARQQATPLDPVARRISGVLEHPGAPSSETDSTVRDFPDFPDFADSADFVRFDADETDDDGGANVHPFVPRAVPDAVEEIEDAEPDVDEPADPELAETEAEPPGSEVRAGDEVPAGQATPAQPAQAQPAQPPQSARSSRRAKVPKWDDIMFGMKPKDGS